MVSVFDCVLSQWYFYVWITLSKREKNQVQTDGADWSTYSEIITGNIDSSLHCHCCLWVVGLRPGPHKSWPNTAEAHFLAALWIDEEEQQYLDHLTEGRPWMNPADTRTHTTRAELFCTVLIWVPGTVNWAETGLDHELYFLLVDFPVVKYIVIKTY